MLPRKKASIFQNGSPSFLHFVFYHLRHVQKTKWGPGAIFVLLLEIGLLGTLEDSESPMEYAGVWLSVSVESLMECQMRVIDVFWAVSLSGTIRPSMVVPLEKNACHLLKSESGPLSW